MERTSRLAGAYTPMHPPCSTPTPFHDRGRVNSDFELDSRGLLPEVGAIRDLSEREAVPVLGLHRAVGAPAGDLVEAPGSHIVPEPSGTFPLQAARHASHVVLRDGPRVAPGCGPDGEVCSHGSISC